MESSYGFNPMDLMRYICETMEVISHGSYV